jgi:hypothetical protein
MWRGGGRRKATATGRGASGGAAGTAAAATALGLVVDQGGINKQLWRPPRSHHSHPPGTRVRSLVPRAPLYTSSHTRSGKQRERRGTGRRNLRDIAGVYIAPPPRDSCPEPERSPHHAPNDAAFAMIPRTALLAGGPWLSQSRPPARRPRLIQKRSASIASVPFASAPAALRRPPPARRLTQRKPLWPCRP